MCDTASSNLLGSAVAAESSSEFVEALERGGLGDLGSPETLRVDAGNVFNFAEFRSCSDRVGILVKPAIGEAHTSNAIV